MRDHVVGSHITAGAPAAGEAAVPVAGADPSGPGWGPVCIRSRAGAGPKVIGRRRGWGAGVFSAQRAVAGEFRAGRGDDHLYRDRVAGAEPGEQGDQGVPRGRRRRRLRCGNRGAVGVPAGLGFFCAQVRPGVAMPSDSGDPDPAGAYGAFAAARGRVGSIAAIWRASQARSCAQVCPVA